MHRLSSYFLMTGFTEINANYERSEQKSAVRCMDSRSFALFGLVSPSANAILLQSQRPSDSARDPFKRSDSRKHRTDNEHIQEEMFLTNSAELSPSSGAASCLAIQEFHNIQWNHLGVFTRVLHWSLS
jgi:hypothetical protein